MSTNSNKISQFWKELKRRRVIHVITVYASSAFILIELVNNLAEPLNLPDNLATIVVIILAVGFPLAIIMSWLYDLTSEGVEKTKPLSEMQEGEKTVIPNAWKIATYVSFAVIVGLVVLNLAGRNKLVKPGSIQSLIILPFDNFTGTDTLEYFVSGMHSSLITDMQQISALRVKGKTTANSFKGTDLSLTQIASEIKVDAAVEGSISCFGKDSVCVQIRVIKAKGEEKQLWVEDYRVAKDQILNFYNDVTKKISEEINIVLTPEEERLLAKSRTVDREVYDAYLKSYEYMGNFSRESLNKAMEYLNSAIEKDPDWAPLYLGLANAWMMFAQMGFEAPSTAVSAAYENLNKALELDLDLPDAHHLMGWIAFVSEWNWAKAEREFLKALAINPNDALSRIWYAHLLCVLQRHNEALPQAQLAIDLDPLNPLVQIMFSAAQLFINECEADLTQIEKLLADNPNNLMANYMLNIVSFRCEDFDKVIETEPHYLQLVRGVQFDEKAFKEIKRIYNEQGFSAAYEKIVPLYEDLVNNKIIGPMEMSIVYTKGNQYDKVMDLIEKGYEIHDPTMPYIAIKAYNFEPLYDDPRFIDIVEKMNLPLPEK